MDGKSQDVFKQLIDNGNIKENIFGIESRNVLIH